MGLISANKLSRLLLCLSYAGSFAVVAQTVELKPVDPVALPVLVDSNTPAFWRDGRFHFFSSGGAPLISSGIDQFSVDSSELVLRSPDMPSPMWVESVWQDPSGILLLWYHHEVVGLCGDILPTEPKVGAALSFDGGRTMIDLGIVLESGDPIDCNAQNGYFGTGHGDFSVVFNPTDNYFYFFFSNYGGDLANQGISVARMHSDFRFNPAGYVEKYYQGQWSEPGLKGKVTPIMPATVAWQREDADSFWGPSIHWNTHLNQFVMLLNRSCCSPGWPQEGIYVSYNSDLSNPEGWKTPEKIFEGGLWYPSVLGLGPNETDSVAGQTSRLYFRGASEWEIVFHKPGEEPEPLLAKRGRN